jgi:hypothetical protein
MAYDRVYAWRTPTTREPKAHRCTDFVRLTCRAESGRRAELLSCPGQVGVRSGLFYWVEADPFFILAPDYRWGCGWMQESGVVGLHAGICAGGWTTGIPPTTFTTKEQPF